MKLLITDLDNTLYDWVTFYARSFEAMVEQLAQKLGESEEVLLTEFRTLHQRYGTSEPPFVMLELPSVRRQFGELSRHELKELLPEPIQAFNAARSQSLLLYPDVEDTLRQLQSWGVPVVGHTEAISETAIHRLRKLGILKYFKHLYVLDRPIEDHPIPGRKQELAPPPGLVIRESNRKPNPGVLLDICAREGVHPSEAVYVGDSLVRDISMAKAAGLIAVWSRYGTRYDPSSWAILKSVSHWTAEDVAREEQLRLSTQTIVPDFEIDSFAELLDPRILRFNPASP